MDALISLYRAARSNYRAAFFAYQRASGADFLPAMDAWIAADREVKRIEALLAATRKAA